MQRNVRPHPGSIAVLALLLVGCTVVAQAQRADTPFPSSRPGIDAPQLAPPGPHAVGVRELKLVDPARLNLLAADPKTGVIPRQDRSLEVMVWYPADTAPGATPVVYEDVLDAEPPAPPARFRIPGLAIADARPAAGTHPLVVVSHGYGNVPAAMSWLTENLASKGYVVAAIRHADQYLNPAGLPGSLLNRPLDIAFVTRELQGAAGKAYGVDPQRTALIGYSMGGFGVLAAGGATLDASGPLSRMLPSDVLMPHSRGGAAADTLVAPNVRAIVALAPAGGAFGAWGANGLAAIRAPMLLISGDRDQTVPFESGARAYLDQAVNADRYLLVFRGGGHAIGLGHAPPEMRASLWDQDWFEDTVWRKDRLIGVSLHFITAFLDRELKGDASRSAFLDGLVEDSSQGTWNAPSGTPWGAYSPGGEGVTLWKGFQRRHAEGLTLQHRKAGG